MRRVLITGAASGLGKAMAARYAAAGAQVVIADINVAAGCATAAEISQSAAAHEGELLPTPAGGAVVFMHLDVRQDSAWDHVRDWVIAHWDGLDLLVNNAGVSAAGRIEAVTGADWEWITEINLLAVVRGCRTFVPLMKEQNSGHIVNVASMAGLIDPPFMASYNVTKAGVVALSETLRFELEPWGIGTTVLCPSFVKTNLASSFRSPDPVMAEISAKLINNGKISADELADQVYHAVQGRKFLLITDRPSKIAWFAKRFLGPVYRRKASQAAHRLRTRIENSAPAG